MSKDTDATAGRLPADFAKDRAEFAKKRARDRQKAQCLAQFGPGGGGIPPNPEPDKPTKMAVNE